MRTTGTPNRSSPPTPIRCAVYTRKSTEHGLEQEYSSLDAQRDSGEAFVKSRETLGWVCLPARYDDGGFSGGNLERPALNRLLADIKAGLIDCVVVYKVDRLSRSLADFSKLIALFDELGVTFVSVTQNFNTTDSMGRLTLNILLSFAQFERELISERTRDKMAASRRRGKFGGGRPILGYDLADSKLTINPLEAEQVRQIFQMYLDQQSLLSVVKTLNQRGWTTKRWTTQNGKIRGGNAFTKNNLSYLLHNLVYIGKVPYHDQVFEGEHPGIIDLEVFEQTQTLLRQHTRSGGQGPRSQHGGVLVGLLRCQSCGCTMTHTYTAKGRKRYRYYVCGRAQKRGYAACPAPTVSAPQIERFIVDKIRAIGDDERVLQGVLNELQLEVDQQRPRLEQEQQLLQQQVTAAYTELAQVAIRPGTEQRMAILQEQIDRDQQRIVEIRRQLTTPCAEQLSAEMVRERLQEFQPLWQTLTIYKQAELLKLLIKSVELDGPSGKLTIHYHPHGIQTLLKQETTT